MARTRRFGAVVEANSEPHTPVTVALMVKKRSCRMTRGRMNPIPLKRSLWLFGIPASWLALLGIAAAVEKTPWGHRGHPSNGIVMLIYVLLGAPIFGLVGWIYAVLGKGLYSRRTKVIAILTNLCLIGLGVYCWLWFY